MVAGPVGGLARMLAAQQELESRAADQPAPADPASAQAESAPARIYYFHTQANGLPEEMSDRNGNLVWRTQYRVWGSAVAEEWQAFDAAGRPVGTPVAEGWARASQQTAAAPQNLRMQGQYLDRETGLHYNTFRYYDPDLGTFTTPDPMGLGGGINLHRYGINPISYADALGLAPCTTDLTGHRKDHILNRHRSGANKPGKTEFPAHWTDADILHHVSDVATDPASITGAGKWNSPYAIGVRDGVEIRVDFYPPSHPTYSGQISTAYPINVAPNPP